MNRPDRQPPAGVALKSWLSKRRKLRVPEPVLVDAQATNLRLERLSRNSQPGRGPGRTRDAALAIRERSFDEGPFALAIPAQRTVRYAPATRFFRELGL